MSHALSLQHSMHCQECCLSDMMISSYVGRNFSSLIATVSAGPGERQSRYLARGSVC